MRRNIDMRIDYYFTKHIGAKHRTQGCRGNRYNSRTKKNKRK